MHDHSKKRPESERATAVDKEDTDGTGEKKDKNASDPSQTGPQSEVTYSGDPSKNGPKDKAGPEMVSPGEGVQMMELISHQKVKIKRLIVLKNKRKVLSFPIVLQNLHHQPIILPMILAMMLELGLMVNIVRMSGFFLK